MKRVVLVTAGVALLLPGPALAQTEPQRNEVEAPSALQQPPAAQPATQPAQPASGTQEGFAAPAAPQAAGGTTPAAPQSGDAAPAPPQAEGAAPSAPQDNGAITITATPESGSAQPPPQPAPQYPVAPAGPPPGSYGYGYNYNYGYGYGYGYTPYTSPTPPASPDTPRAIAASWRRRFALGGTFGLGSPLGVLGAFGEWNVSQVVGLTAGAGLGGTFGPALALGGYVRPTTWGRWAPTLGAGYSINFTPARFFGDPNITVPGQSHWLNFEAGMEYRSFRGVLFRAMLGHTVLLNTGAFTNRDAGGRYGPASSISVGYDPVSAADAHDEGTALHFMFFHAEIGFVFGG